MTAQMIVTENRVILSDDATREELQHACAEHPGKSVVKASSLRLAAAPEDNKAMADLQTRVRKLETLVAGLLAEKQTQTQAVRPVVTANPEPEAPKAEESEIDADILPGEEEPTVEETRAYTAQTMTAAKAKTPKKAVIKSPAAPAAPRKKLSEMSVEELRKRVERRGGNPDRIMKGKHARARNKALVAWIVAKKREEREAR